MSTSRVFVSHNSADKEVARDIAAAMARHGVDVWFDEWKIQVGDSIVDRVSDGLSRATHVLVVWSASAARSAWVGRELSATIAQMIDAGSPRVVPVRLDDTALPSVIRDLRYFRYNRDLRSSAEELGRALVGSTSTQEHIKAVFAAANALVREHKACPECGCLTAVEDPNPYFGSLDAGCFPQYICADCGKPWNPLP